MKIIAPFLLLALGGTAALAADLQVTVATASGRPAPDVVVMVVPAGATAATAASVDIHQKDNRFDPYVTAVPAGATVRFVNRDPYDHHVRSLGSGPLGAVPPAKSFELRLPPPGKATGKVQDTVVFETPGAVTLGCHIHGSMRGHLFIATTPFVAVTDEFGRATVRGLPDGAAELRLWHPDQITGQNPQALTLGGQTTAKAALSFNPQRRPMPRKTEYD